MLNQALKSIMGKVQHLIFKSTIISESVAQVEEENAEEGTGGQSSLLNFFTEQSEHILSLRSLRFVSVDSPEFIVLVLTNLNKVLESEIENDQTMGTKLKQILTEIEFTSSTLDQECSSSLVLYMR